MGWCVRRYRCVAVWYTFFCEKLGVLYCRALDIPCSDLSNVSVLLLYFCFVHMMCSLLLKFVFCIQRLLWFIGRLFMADDLYCSESCMFFLCSSIIYLAHISISSHYLFVHAQQCCLCRNTWIYWC